jgi:hypothetical protein
VCEYQAGRTLADLVSALGIHRRTIAANLEARGIQRRVNGRKMTDDDVGDAARRYRAGDSLSPRSPWSSTSIPRPCAASYIERE